MSRIKQMIEETEAELHWRKLSSETIAGVAKHLTDDHPLRIVHCPVTVARSRARSSNKLLPKLSHLALLNSNGVEVAACFERRVGDALAELVNAGADNMLAGLQKVARRPAPEAASPSGIVEPVAEPVVQPRDGLVFVTPPSAQMYEQCSDSTLGSCLLKLQEHVNLVAYALKLRGWTVDLVASSGSLSSEVKRTEFLTGG